MVMMQCYPVIDLSATGANIERLRKARGLSVRDLQDYFGFEAPQAIYKWQRGQSLPTVDNLYALSALLHVPMETILVSSTPSVIYKEAVCESKQPLPFYPFFGFVFRSLRRRGMRQSKAMSPSIVSKLLLSARLDPFGASLAA